MNYPFLIPELLPIAYKLDNANKKVYTLLITLINVVVNRIPQQNEQLNLNQ